LNRWIWIRKGRPIPNRSRTPARQPLFGPNVLPYVRSEKKNKTAKDRIKEFIKRKKKQKEHKKKSNR
jgi:hypothetical protein